MTSSPSLDLRHYLQVLKRRRWLVTVAIAAVVGSTVVVTDQITPVYRAVARVEIAPLLPGSAEGGVGVDEAVGSATSLQTQVERFKGNAVLEPAARRVGLESVEPLSEAMTAALIPDTQIIEVAVEHEHPQVARNWANAVVQEYMNLRRRALQEAIVQQTQNLERQVSEVKRNISDIDQQLARRDDPNLQVQRDTLVARLNGLIGRQMEFPEPSTLANAGQESITPAQTPDRPDRPKKLRNIGISIVLGIGLALAGVIVAENLDDRLKGPEEVESSLGAPVIGQIPFVDDWLKRGRGSLATVDGELPEVAEAYRILATNLKFAGVEKPLRSVLITSPFPEAGKTTTAANLATVLAQSGSKTVLVSADLRRPSVHKLFGMTNSRGLLNLMQPKASYLQAVQRHEHSGLRVLAVGGTPSDPTQILASARFARVIEVLEEQSDFVVFDAPPVLGLGDASLLASKVDGIVFVINTETVTRRELVDAADQIRKAGGVITGCVLNGVVPEPRSGYYYQRYSSDGPTNASPNGVSSNLRRYKYKMTKKP